MKRYLHSIKHYLDQELFHLPDSPRRQLTLLLGAIVVGIITGLSLPLPPLVWPWIAGIALIALGRFAGQKVSWSLIAIGVLLIGLARGSNVGVTQRWLREQIGGTQTMTGTVANFGRENLASWSFLVDVEQVDRDFVSFPLRVTSPMRVERGSQVRIACKLVEQGSGFGCRGGVIDVLRPAGAIYRALNGVREATFEKLKEYLSPDRAALLAGMVYGGDEALPQQTRDEFRASGLSHLIAVSGSNLALVTVALYGFLTAFWLRRRRAAAVTLAVLGLATLFVGLDSSVVRAGIMGSLILIGYLLGRPRSSGNALLLAAALMLFMNPWLMFDLGFLLSCSATAGLMFLSSPIERKLSFIPAFGSIRATVAIALAAWLATMPVLALVLGSVQVISPIANVIAVPFASAIFVLGVACCFIAWIPGIASVAAPLLGFFLDALRFIAALFANVPFGTLSSSFAVWSAVIGSCAVMLWLLRTAGDEDSIAKSS